MDLGPLPEPISHKEQVALVARARAGDAKARARLIETSP